jgi:DNA repair exonuclease SbcCD ATPase subunit
LTKQSHDFKKRWYGLSGKAEGLSKYKSGFEEGFKSDVKAVYDDIDLCKDYVDRFEQHLKHYFPEHRTDITWMTKKVFRHLEELRVMAKKDYDVLENSKDLSQNLKSLIEERDKAEAKLNVSEKKSGEACRKYFDLKNEYTAEYQAIEDAVKKKLSKIKDKFFEMTTPIVEGHDILVASRNVSVSELFEILAEKPLDAEKISLVIKKGGIFGKKAETDVAKTSVLKYVSGEILEGVAPIEKEKKKLVEKLKSQYVDLPKLEKACESSENQRKKLEKPVNDIRAKISDLKRSEVFKFGDYDGILETREHYIEKIGEAEKEVKAYIDFSMLNLKGFVELETDVEKRTLLTEITTAKKKAAASETEAAKAREDLLAKTKELTKSTAAKEALEKKLTQSAKLQKAAESDAAEKGKRLDDVNNRVRELEKTMRLNLKALESEIEAKLSDISKAMAASAARKIDKKAEKKVEKKVANLRGKKK